MISLKSEAGTYFSPMKAPLQLQFTDVLTYSGAEAGITLSVKLFSGGIECETEAKFDPARTSVSSAGKSESSLDLT
jgi:hypothetical protein